jgi:uncharacterized protein YbbK (DUF523 family)/uncharacterized protein YbgA (DUF1722 family)
LVEEERGMDQNVASRIKVGVSGCLMGIEVRYDGGHCKDHYVRNVLGQYLDLIPVCPELESGMSVPRPTIRLEKVGRRRRLVEPKSRRDWTDVVTATSDRILDGLTSVSLDGFILKSRSPTCGMERVKVWSGDSSNKKGVGVFAQRLQKRFPYLPLEEEGRLHDTVLRERFIEAIYAHHRVTDFLRGDWEARDLQEFHARAKFQLMAHSPSLAKKAGRIVASLSRRNRDSVARKYFETYMSAIRTPASRGRHVNVLQHLAGFFRGSLGDWEVEELGDVFNQFCRGLVPLIVPISLIRHHVKRMEVQYLAGQTYIDPYPRELALRSVV